MNERNSDELEVLVSSIYETHKEHHNLFQTFVKK
jgi:hypothetical protein